MPKEVAKKGTARGGRDRAGLAVQMREDVTVEAAAKAKDARRKFMGAAAARDDDVEADDVGAAVAAAVEEDGDGYISAKMSRRILEEARAQQVEDGDGGDGAGARGGKKRVRFGGGGAGGGGSGGGGGAAKAAMAGVLRKRRGGGDDDDDDDDEEEVEEEIIEFAADDDVHLEGDYVDARLDGYATDAGALAAEEAILRRFMPDAPSERRTLADIIMEKFKEREEAEAAAAAAAAGGGDGGGDDAPAPPTMDPKVVEVYTEVGRFLSHYKSGKLPKVFKIIPGLASWEEVLFMTNPETWTPHATYAATRIFASNFNPAKAQRFFNLILLPKCRDDVYFNKRLNFHLYLALKKAAYKPAAFYKGIILPLAAAPDATLKEAIIIGSVIGKVSLPQLHSAATLIKLCQMRYNGAVSVLLRMLINKKYTLPYMAVDEVVRHFEGFREVAGPMPTIWHQCMLTFAQRYKGDLTAPQKESLRELLHVHSHHAITPEVRRELFSVGCRGDAPTAALPAPAAAPVVVGPLATGFAVAPPRPAAPPRAARGGMDIEY